MNPGAVERCPRCGGAFRCGRDDAAPCPCTTVRLDAPTLARLRERWQGCLCLPCLAALAAGEAVDAAGSRPDLAPPTLAPGRSAGNSNR
jgi:hypothetical protein